MKPLRRAWRSRCAGNTLTGEGAVDGRYTLENMTFRRHRLPWSGRYLNASYWKPALGEPPDLHGWQGRGGKSWSNKLLPGLTPLL